MSLKSNMCSSWNTTQTWPCVFIYIIDFNTYQRPCSWSQASVDSKAAAQSINSRLVSWVWPTSSFGYLRYHRSWARTLHVSCTRPRALSGLVPQFTTNRTNPHTNANESREITSWHHDIIDHRFTTSRRQSDYYVVSNFILLLLGWMLPDC